MFVCVLYWKIKHFHSFKFNYWFIFSLFKWQTFKITSLRFMWQFLTLFNFVQITTAQNKIEASSQLNVISEYYEKNKSIHHRSLGSDNFSVFFFSSLNWQAQKLISVSEQTLNIYMYTFTSIVLHWKTRITITNTVRMVFILFKHFVTVCV